MYRIGGNTTAKIQTKDAGTKNGIGERIHTWVDAVTLTGFLDYMTGDSKYATFNAKLQETTHIFICDYQQLTVTSETSRLIHEGKTYEILLIDDPMGLHQQLEIYLKYVGA